MRSQQYLNITNRINELHFWLIGYLDAERRDEADLLQKLERNIKSMKAITEKHGKRGDKV